MKTLAILAMVICLMGGCATAPTQQTCAQITAYIQACDAALAVAEPGSEVMKYWTAAKAGATIALAANCAGAK